MDIRFVNNRNEIINTTNLNIKVNGVYLIGEDVNGSIKTIEKYENEEQAKDVLRQIADTLLHDKDLSQEEIIIDLRKKEDK